MKNRSIPAMTAALLALGGLLFTAPARASDAPLPDGARGMVEQAIRDRIAAEYAAPHREVSVESVELPAAFRAPDSFDRIEIDLPYRSRTGEKVFVTVTLRDDGQVAARANGSATVAMYARAVVAARDLPRSTLLAGDDLSVERIRVGAGYGQLVDDPSEAVGRRIDRLVRAGEPILAGRLVTPKMVGNGDLVTVVADTGRLRITTIARAEEEGERGDWIAVTNMESKKTFNARVTGPGEVAVAF